MLEIAVIQFIAGIQMLMKALNHSKFRQLWNSIGKHSFGLIGQFINQLDRPSGVLGLLGIGMLVIAVLSLVSALCSSKVLRIISLVLTFAVVIFSAVYWREDLTGYIEQTIDTLSTTFRWMGMLSKK